MDGTSKVIDVEDGATAFKTTGAGKTINSWFKYTVDKDGVYTLTKVENTTEIPFDDNGDVAQKQDTTTAQINDKHISLTSIGKYVYGNEDSIYLLADLDTVGTTTVIKGVDEVVTGVENAAFTVTKVGDSKGVYTLYDDNAYVIAAVVVGESDTVSKNVAYVISDGLADESYDKVAGEWTWTRKVIINGEEVILSETNDKDKSVLEEYDVDADGRWAVVRYDADGNVKKIEKLDDDFYTTIASAVAAIEADNDVVYVQIADEDTHHEYTLKGNTLYDDTNDELGFLVSTDVKIALKQEVNNKTTTTYEEGVNTLKSILADLNEAAKIYEFNAVIENGRATSVIIIDKGSDNDYQGPNGSGDVELKGDWSIENPVLVDPAKGTSYINNLMMEGKNVHVDGDLTLNAALVIPKNVTLLVNGDLTSNGKKIVNNGALKVMGEMDVTDSQSSLDGTVVAMYVKFWGNTTINGTVIVKDNGSGDYGYVETNNKNLTIASGAELYVNEGKKSVDLGNGKLVINGHMECVGGTVKALGGVEDNSDHSLIVGTLITNALTVNGGNTTVANLQADTVVVKANGDLVVTTSVADQAGTGTAAITVVDGTFDVSKVDEDKMDVAITEGDTCEVTSVEALKKALEDEDIKTIVINGTLGNTEEYTVYDVERAVTIQGGTVYGSFAVGVDGVTFDGVTIKNHGNGTDDEGNKNGITASCKKITIVNCTFNMGETKEFGNGVFIYPTAADVDYTIQGNTFIAVDNDVEGWNCTGLGIANNFAKPGVTNVSGKATAEFAEGELSEMEASNTFENCTYNLVNSHWDDEGRFKSQTVYPLEK